MGNPIREIEYEGFDGLWKLNVNGDNISVEKDGEVRVYDLNMNEITTVEQELEYVYLNILGGGFYQVKFEVDSFLVIDMFNRHGEHLKEIGAHVFGE